MAISQAEAKRAAQAALEYWVGALDTQKLAIDDLPKEDIAPIIFSRTHTDPETGTVIQVGGLLFLSENIEGTKELLKRLLASLTRQAGEQQSKRSHDD